VLELDDDDERMEEQLRKHSEKIEAKRAIQQLHVSENAEKARI
jgi:hypothetical protein